MRTFKTVVVGGVFVLSLLAIGCTKHPSDQDLQTLNETRSAAEQADKTVQNLQKQKRDLQAELESKKDELARAKAEQARVKQTINEKQMSE